MHSDKTTTVSYRLPTPPLVRPSHPLPLPPPPRPPPPRTRRAEPKKMSSNCTITRLVRWRVKDFASCFFACRLPLEEGTGKSSNVTSKKPNRSMVYDSQGSNREHESRRKMKKMQDGSSSRNKRNGAAIRPEANDGTDSEWPHFAEEEYIVFCFREDGEIHMVNEVYHSEAFDGDESLTLMPIHTKVDEERSDGEELDWPPDEVKEINPVVEDSNGTKMDSFESCDSNLSDESTSSFAFPVLGNEWIGSPVQMPKSDKNKINESVHLNCWTF